MSKRGDAMHVQIYRHSIMIYTELLATLLLGILYNFIDK